ncbi:SDR family NAD(P)-dependent oxidoreductase [Kribbella sp. VKM Ac-2568]|uniref:SDR family NAD(P)-dependent oxidoreductase n=1 Tax=Kribbella sp. VKM Ac-2568 TaxID=2512219 RepID=UPI0010D0817C|nr:SDR family NAD(P)-dependent oxidoreductase [Kribbella sp. VKM Ac-2568]TCM43550.1 short subunit dehydrogenase [Kribbella sp. VKM Ac-2568]
MLLDGKVAIVHGGGGAMGGAVARAFAREGATVHLAGRTLAKLEKVAADIAEAGGRATTAVVDGYDAEAVEAYTASMKGPIDVCFNGVSVREKQNVPLVDLSVEDSSGRSRTRPGPTSSPPPRPRAG